MAKKKSGNEAAKNKPTPTAEVSGELLDAGQVQEGPASLDVEKEKGITITAMNPEEFEGDVISKPAVDTTPAPEATVTKELAEEVSEEPAESPFKVAIEMAAANPMDKLHLANLVESVNDLFDVKKEGAVAGDYEALGHKLASMTRSLGTISDGVFVAVMPVILDIFDAKVKEGGFLFTDNVASYKIFAHNKDNRALTKDHAKFITAIAALAPKASRGKVGKGIDIEVNFAVLPDAKRTRIKDIFR